MHELLNRWFEETHTKLPTTVCCPKQGPNATKNGLKLHTTSGHRSKVRSSGDLDPSKSAAMSQETKERH